MFCLNFGIIRQAGRMAQSVCCCLCIMVCAGPILLIAGIIVLALPNTRKEDVEKYNTDAAQFNAAPVSNWNGTIGGLTASSITETVTVESGSSEDVDTFTSVYRSASVDISTEPSPIPYSLSTVEDFTASVPSSTYTKSKSGSVKCRSSSWCSRSKVDSLCEEEYGSSAYASSSSSCKEDDSCGCTYYVYLDTYCLVATESSGANAFVQSTVYRSCYYPFTSTNTQKFSRDKSTVVPFQLRMDTDPFVIMQKITKGDMDFGLTLAQQRKIAAALIAIGCVMIGCIVIVAFILYKVIKAFTDKSGGDSSSQPMTQQQQYSQPQSPQNYPSQQPPPQQYQPQPAYGQPQPAYGQPQPAYGQPQPAYGQPQPAYGQPQPAYGQPQPAYGQPGV